VGIPESHPAIQEAIRRGLILPQAGHPEPKGPTERASLVVPSFDPSGPTWVIPLRVVAGDNARGSKAKIGRAGHERRAVSRALGPCLSHLAPLACDVHHGGRRLVVSLTRLGGRGLDPADNLPASCKFVLDTVCMFFGIDDKAGSPLRVVYDQSPGGAAGVRLTLATEVP